MTPGLKAGGRILETTKGLRTTPDLLLEPSGGDLEDGRRD